MTILQAYWSAMRDDSQVPWISTSSGESVRPSEVFRKQRPSAMHQFMPSSKIISFTLSSITFHFISCLKFDSAQL
jgi:hypothetical protein